MGAPVVWFEVAGRDLDTLRQFYSSLFGWRIELDPAAPIPYGLVKTGAEGGIPGGIYAPGEPAGNYVSFYVAVDDLERSLQQAETLGAKVPSRPPRWPMAAAWPWSMTPRATASASSSRPHRRPEPAPGHRCQAGGRCHGGMACSEAMNRTDRLYALVEELRAVAPRPRSARRLAQQFEVSTRTIERDLAALQQAGVPIWATPGPGGGYVLDPARTLPPLNFTPSEAAAIALALAASGPIPFGDAARAALRKVTAAMSTADRTGAHALLDRIRLLQREGLAVAPALRVVERALLGQRVVRLDYQDKQGRVTHGRLVEPLGFVVGEQHTYLHGWCRLRNGPRAFRLDRIRHAAITAEPARNHQGPQRLAHPGRELFPVQAMTARQ